VRSFLKVGGSMVSGGRHNEEWRGGWSLEVEDDQRKLGRWAECTVGLNC
jgi:hypothetical protein